MLIMEASDVMVWWLVFLWGYVVAVFELFILLGGCFLTARQ